MNAVRHLLNRIVTVQVCDPRHSSGHGATDDDSSNVACSTIKNLRN
jgi:hypothetical protein